MKSVIIEYECRNADGQRNLEIMSGTALKDVESVTFRNPEFENMVI